MDARLVSGVVSKVPDRVKGLFSTPAEYEFLHYAMNHSLQRSDGQIIDKRAVVFPAEIDYQGLFNRLKHRNPDSDKRYAELEKIARNFIKMNDLSMGSNVPLIEKFERRKSQNTVAYETIFGDDSLIVGTIGYISKDTLGLFDGMPNVEWAVRNPVNVSENHFGTYNRREMIRFVSYWLREHD